MIHDLPLGSTRLHGAFSRDLPPVLTVDPGDSVRFSLPNSAWRLGPDEELERPDPGVDTGHALLGPIEVRGARAGQTLAVRVDEVTPGGWGETFDGAGSRVHWELRDGLGHTGGRTVRLAPFLGVLGMPPAEPGIHSTRPPRPTGGNVDCKELVAGTTLYLPIAVDGALFSAGDGHAVQGDGEVNLMALETAMSGTFELILHKGKSLTFPRAITATHYIAMGTDPDLDDAAKQALREMIKWLVELKGWAPEDAYTFCSLACDLRVTQLVDGFKGIHAMVARELID